ncbi:structural maintenance of chromosomes protein 4 [[Candida] jaroonii]|uniref:Structural maintenance of chromosomes protein 4 n=1 Tax=[Candida] jaroonii TaxID=467808 RepID=A0ACA9Y456_9ASCO|nr:structural maintenance of chromosomes protein 4 [[Candida] jaroonii]
MVRGKRRIASSDDEDVEDTFINNSDLQPTSALTVNGSTADSNSYSDNESNNDDNEPHEDKESNDSDDKEEFQDAPQNPEVSEGSDVSDKDTPDISKHNETSDTSDDITREMIEHQASDESKTHIDPDHESTEIKVDENQVNAEEHPVEQPVENHVETNQNGEIDGPIPTKTPKNEPRLVIEQLVLTNFKSYAGRQVIGPFNASFSAVVGPNGSGKSNVIDSMLFVFGFRASKMRQGKLSELIHNSEGERMEFCQVDIHFNHVIDDNENENAKIVDNSQLIVSRKAFKNNSSQYYINGRTSNYTEVTTLLKDKGIDLDHKRFLILQGEVESIAQMKPKAEKENDDGLLEYLEDIIGTSHYKGMIEESLTKIDELNDICIEKSNRFELVEKDKDQLEDKKNEALKFLEMEKKLINAKSIQFQISLNKNNSKLTKVLQSLEELKAGHHEEMTKNQLLMEILQENQNNQRSLTKEIGKFTKEINHLQEKSKVLNKHIVSVDEKIKNLTSKVKKLSKNKESSEHSLSMARSKLEQELKVSEEYKLELENLTNEMSVERIKLDEIRLKLKSKTSAYTEEIEKLTNQLEPWNDKLKQEDNQIQLIDSSIDILVKEKESFQKKLDNARERLISIKNEGKQKEQEYVEIQNKLDHYEEQIKLGEETVTNERKSLTATKTKLDNFRMKINELVNVANHNQNKNRVLNGLSKLSKSGRIQGFHGRLGDLGVIDDRYDIAISTACPALDSMVVDTVETAQICIQYLRKNNLGYANFICLEKLRKFNLSPIKTPGNPQTVKRLFDLITAKDDKFLPAFYSKIFDTLVASNLQEARQVAYGAKRYRVVTLDGKLVDTSGTMSGGGNSFQKGGMLLASQKSVDVEMIDEDELNNEKAKLSDMEISYDKLAKDYQIKLDQLNNLKNTLPDVQLSLDKLKLDIESLGSEKREVSTLIKRLIDESTNSENTKELEDRIQQQESVKQGHVNARNELKEQMKDLETKISELEEKIMEAGGVELRLQNSKIDSIKQKIEIINDKSSNDKISKRKLENEIKKHTKIVEENSIEITNVEQELSEISNTDNSKQQELDEINTTIAKLEDEKIEVENKLTEIKAEHEIKQKEVNQFKSLEIEFNNKLEQLTNQENSLKSKITNNEINLDSLIVRECSEYIHWLPEEEQVKYNSTNIEKLTDEDIENINFDDINEEIHTIEEYMKNVKVDIEILKEYGNKLQEFGVRQTELNQSISSRDEIKNHCEELKRKRLDEFMEGFNTISLSLKEMYQMITMGGNAELELVDSLDPFSEGILFSVMPPKKSWKNISNLSGGEKTLSSLALVFALHKFKPTPLYVMDEIDAALDFRNVSIVANYIKERTKNGQFIVISLRNNMFELAKQLVGIYKVSHRTRSISLKNKEFL